MDGSVQCVVTSPPYWGLRKYSGDMVQVFGGEEGCAHEWGDEIIAKANDSNRGTMEWTTGGDPGAKVMGTKPSQGMFCRHCGAWRGELGLEPTIELYVEHIVEIFREVWRVGRDDMTVWLNLGDSYATHAGSKNTKHSHNFRKPDVAIKEGIYQPRPYGKAIGLKEKDLCGIPWRVAFALQADGWYLRSDIIWAKPNPMPESVTDRPTKSHEYLFLLTKQPKYYYDSDAVRERANYDGRHDTMMKGSPKYKDGFVPNQREQTVHARGHERWPHSTEDGGRGRNRRTVWQIATQSYKGSHFATFPEALVDPCIRAATSAHGCCPACGAGWVRCVEPTPEYAKYLGRGWNDHTKDNTHGSIKDDTKGARTTKSVTTTGWTPTCECGRHDVVPQVVLDPFCGSGTTLVVARKLVRRGVGTDLSLPYLRDQARARLGLDKLSAWQNGRQEVETKLEGLPMFEVP